MDGKTKDEDLTSARSASSTKLDTERYLPQMDGFDLTEAQKIELLQSLWSIMKAFVDIGFSVDSIHSYFPELARNPSAVQEDAIEYKDRNRILEFETAVSDQAATDGKS